MTIVNKLNDLDGKRWMQFTKSWLVLNPRPRDIKKIHPSCFPEELAREFIQFFTKKGDWVFDPFLGSGTTSVEAKQLLRNSVGIELYPKFITLAQERINNLENKSNIKSYIFPGDARNILEIFKKNKLPKMNFCLTSPPYWNQLHMKHRRQKSRIENGFLTTYGKNKLDLGNITNYYDFLEELNKVFEGVYNVMLNNSYLAVICNNIYKNGKIWPLAFDLYRIVSKYWEPKDERIWCQDNKKLRPFGFFREWIANRCHHYCFIFKKKN